MNILYLDCGMGASGDMLLGALLPLQDDPKAALNALNTFDARIRVSAEETCVSGLTGTRVQVRVDGEDEDAHHDHDAHHHGASLDGICARIDMLPVSGKVRADAKAVYGLLAKAEAAAHGGDTHAVHFHEVGMLDAIADITGVCMLLDALQPVRIVASPVHVGSGTVRCAHGELPVPAPATARLLEGVPIYGGAIEGELCTPTGAALLRYFADEFGPLPLMRPVKTADGLGGRAFPRRNALRAILGTDGQAESGPNDAGTELSCNLDDMTGESMAFALGALMQAGARDACYLPVVMKKGRPGCRLICQCAPEDADRLAALILRVTTSFGVQRTDTRRYILERAVRSVETPYGAVRVKRGVGYGANQCKAEYEDAASAARAHGVAPGTVAAAALHAAAEEEE